MLLLSLVRVAETAAASATADKIVIVPYLALATETHRHKGTVEAVRTILNRNRQLSYFKKIVHNRDMEKSFTKTPSNNFLDYASTTVWTTGKEENLISKKVI